MCFIIQFFAGYHSNEVFWPNWQIHFMKGQTRNIGVNIESFSLRLWALTMIRTVLWPLPETNFSISITINFVHHFLKFRRGQCLTKTQHGHFEFINCYESVSIFVEYSVIIIKTNSNNMIIFTWKFLWFLHRHQSYPFLKSSLLWILQNLFMVFNFSKFFIRVYLIFSTRFSFDGDRFLIKNPTPVYKLHHKTYISQINRPIVPLPSLSCSFISWTSSSRAGFRPES